MQYHFRIEEVQISFLENWQEKLVGPKIKILAAKFKRIFVCYKAAVLSQSFECKSFNKIPHKLVYVFSISQKFSHPKNKGAKKACKMAAKYFMI